MKDRKKVLFVGDNPFAYTGNANMLHGLLSNINTDLYLPGCFVTGDFDYALADAFEIPPVNIIPGSSLNDKWGKEKLLKIISKGDFDLLFMVGLDIWSYDEIMKPISDIRDSAGFKWAWLFPYELQSLRKDWTKWMNLLDFPLVYSQYGYDMLKEEVPNLRYYRPYLYPEDVYKPLPEEERKELRAKHFPVVPPDAPLFGFVGVDQRRKDIPKLLKAFAKLVEKTDDPVYLYIHTEQVLTNIYQYAEDHNIFTGNLHAKSSGTYFPPDHMNKLYNMFDCLVNCSYQEGLSWTVIEAMACGVPVIASESTAHLELVEDVGFMVPCTQEATLNVITSSGPCDIDVLACSSDDICRYMERFIECHKKGEIDLKGKVLKKAKEWIAGASDINAFLEEAVAKPESAILPRRKEAVLFAQHSSAGDVLMSTQCLKGIKEKHPNFPLVYMTSSKYMDIVEGNPYINEIIPWDEKLLDKYEIVYNPHGERILPGGFNNLDTRLTDMYPYFCKVDADDIFIQEMEPTGKHVECHVDDDSKVVVDKTTGFALPDEYIVVHTTGGDSLYRTYKKMALAIKNIGLPVVQIGGSDDYFCKGISVDLRGKLTWRETAWVMKRAKGAIVIDSFPAHLAGALETPVVVIFGPAPARVTGPRGNPNKMTFIEPNKLDVCPNNTNCWGQPGTVCRTACIDSVNPFTVKKALMTLIKGDV